MIIIYRGGGRNSKIVQYIYILQVKHFDFQNKKNEYRCSTILRSKTRFVIARRFFLSVLMRLHVTHLV